jgi:hypothetical protein
MKLKANILNDSDYSDYSDDENGLEINEPIDDNIINCQEETTVVNDNHIIIARNLANNESNLSNNNQSNKEIDSSISMLNLRNNPCTSQDSLSKSPLIETLKKRELELGTIIGQIRSDISEHIRNEDEFNYVGLNHLFVH